MIPPGCSFVFVTMRAPRILTFSVNVPSGRLDPSERRAVTPTALGKRFSLLPVGTCIVISALLPLVGGVLSAGRDRWRLIG